MANQSYKLLICVLITILLLKFSLAYHNQHLGNNAKNKANIQMIQVSNQDNPNQEPVQTNQPVQPDTQTSVDNNQTNSSQQNCSEGFFFEQNEQLCFPCSKSCSQCIGFAGNCTSCKEGFYLDDASCIKVCPQGKFANNDSFTCQSCSSPCSQCLSSATNNCTSCIEGLFLDVEQSTCNNNCPERFYADVVSQKCRPCHPSCLTCFQYSTCESCHESFLLLGKCLPNCPMKTWADKQQGQCKYCYAACLSCSGSDPDKCTECEAGFTMQDGICQSPCGDGYFLFSPSTSNEQCKKCHRNCLSCLNEEEASCLSCYESASLLKKQPNQKFGQCFLTCPSGTFSDGWLCNKCHDSCQSCSGPQEIDCLSCENPLLLSDGQCLQHCPLNQYKDEKEKNCLPCHAICKSCSGAGPDQCLACRPGLLLDAGICRNSCSQRKYSDGKRCRHCHASCMDCKGPLDFQCLSCPSSSYLYWAICGKTCEEGFYQDTKQNICAPCQSDCQSCKGPKSEDCFRKKEKFD